MRTSTDTFGVIPGCASHSPICHWKCCTFADNYIVLYPKEFENSKLNKSHLRIIDDDYFGGMRAVCVRPCTRDDLKPLDCRSYPFFPRINEQGGMEILKGRKCPLAGQELVAHQDDVQEIWKQLMTDNAAIRNWLTKVALVGYDLYAVVHEEPELAASAREGCIEYEVGLR